MSTTFSNVMQTALDRYDVPALPEGFADRLVARATSEAAVERKVTPRNRANSPWKRIGQIIGSIGTVGFVSATAAAMGVFGEPLEIPVISDVARDLNLVEESTPIAGKIFPNSELAAQITPDPVGEAGPAVSDTRASKTLSAIVEHPRFDRLSPRQKRRVLRRTSRRLVGSGLSSRDDVKSALRDIRKERLAAGQADLSENGGRASKLKQRINNATPEQKAKMRERLDALPEDRQAIIKERLGLEEISVDPEPKIVEVDENLPTEVAPVTEPAESTAESTEPLPPANAIRQQRIDQLKERFRDATPEQRAKKREQIQQRRNQLRIKQRQRDRRTKLRRRRN